MIPFRRTRELIVSVTNLLEAEGRALKISLIRTAAGVVGLLLALVLGLGGLGMLAAALYSGLIVSGLGVGWAWLITGGVFVLAAGGVAWITMSIATR